MHLEMLNVLVNSGKLNPIGFAGYILPLEVCIVVVNFHAVNTGYVGFGLPGLGHDVESRIASDS